MLVLGELRISSASVGNVSSGKVFPNRAKDCLSLAEHFHQGPFLAVKVKGLKALRGGPAGCRGKIVAALGRSVLDQKLAGFAGYLGRFYVLLSCPHEGSTLAHGLDYILQHLLDGMGLGELEDPPKPHLIIGFGRTWE